MPEINPMTGQQTIHNIERQIVRLTAKTLIAVGHKVTVNDGEKNVLIGSTIVDDIIDACFSKEEDWFHVHRDDEKASFGWIHFVYGNGGWDVIQDHTANLQAVLAPVEELVRSARAAVRMHTSGCECHR